MYLHITTCAYSKTYVSGLPCMTSAFYLIFVAWIKATRPFRKTHAIHKPHTMIIITILHFAISLAFDIAAGFTLHAVPLLILCQACFAVWALVLSIMYFYLYGRIYVRAVVPKKKIRNISLSGQANDSTANGKGVYSPAKSYSSSTQISDEETVPDKCSPQSSVSNNR